jgi:Mn-dependent DtxR family transcriptional regulator
VNDTERFLTCIRDQGPCNAAEAAVRLRIKVGAASAVLMLLDAAGYVRRFDGRYELTEAGATRVVGIHATASKPDQPYLF